VTDPPDIGRTTVVARYVPAAEAARIGGNWYDAFLQRDGSPVVVIGDVVGHDTAAAAAMGRLRGLLRGIAHLTGAGPAEVLRGLDEAIAHMHTETLATAAVARLEHADGDGWSRLRWANAGHPPPPPRGLTLQEPGRGTVGVAVGWASRMGRVPPTRGEGMGRPAWPLRPLPDGRGEVWRWDLVTIAELPAARAALRNRLGGVGFPQDGENTAGERLVLAFDELASNALRHGESPVVATVVAGSGGWLLDVSDQAPETMPAPAVDRDPAQGGLGLHLVARLAVAHGWYVDAGFKHVWACLPTTVEDRQPALA
jgi:anti-sigma regulatory factor (Ser/Thr protein kinase)